MVTTIEGIDCNGRWLDLKSAAVMGIMNVTPDSFSDGGALDEQELVIETAVNMIENGCAIFDIGGESTRPGAAAVSTQQELKRVIPVISQLARDFNRPISVDTSKPEVMEEAINAGAGLINDVRALQEPDALEAAADLNVPVCLMHMQGEPRTMQKNPKYSDDVTGDVIDFLQSRIDACLAKGIHEKNIVLDPGFGFGKALEHNIALFKEIDRIVALGFPVLIGVSRKSMIGQITGLPVDQRDTATATLSVLAAQKGARIMRVHDVLATSQALKMLAAVSG